MPTDLAPAPAKITVLRCRGLLFIGDPHVSSRRISRRKDDYLSSVLGKLTHCAELCRTHGLYPVITGDLFDRSNDSDLRMLNRLVKVLREFPWPPLVVEGNHDRAQTALDEGDALHLLAQVGAVELGAQAGLTKVLQVDGADTCEYVHLYAYPHGSDIPDELPLAQMQQFEPALRVAVTHHDLAFGRAYPGAQPLKPVRGLDMAVNGHMHASRDSELRGSTWWHNPGNIEPVSTDQREHVPRAWQWSPGERGLDCSRLQPHVLPHEGDVFDLTGLRVEAGCAQEAVAALAQKSLFAELMQQQSEALQAARTDDAAILREDLDFVLETAQACEPVRQLLRTLALSLSQDAPAQTLPPEPAGTLGASAADPAVAIGQ
jgi:predicted phosphodiesterase